MVRFKLSVIIASALLSATALAQVASSPKTIPEAVAAGEVRVIFKSNGSSSGDSMTITVVKTAKAQAGTLVLSVPVGLRLDNASRTGQSMIVAGIQGRALNDGTYLREAKVTLPDNNPVTYLLAAYCGDFHKENPSPYSVFTLETANPTVSCILSEARRRNLSVQATQAAVWIYTDHVSFEDINHKLLIIGADWDAASEVVAHCLQNATQSLDSQALTPLSQQPEHGAEPHGLESAPKNNQVGASLEVGGNIRDYTGRVIGNTHDFSGLQRKAVAGDVDAEMSLAAMYFGGIGVAKDYVSALYWYQQAAAQGEPSAETGLGNMYERGLGVAADNGKALDWYSKAAQKGFGPAEYALGHMHEMGLGVQSDKKEAVLWYSRAREHGYVGFAPCDYVDLGFVCLTALERLGKEGYSQTSTTPSVPTNQFAGQSYTRALNFTPDQIASSIARGTKTKGEVQGLVLSDSATQLLQGLQEATVQYGHQAGQVKASGFRVVIFTPLAWVAEQASEAAKQFRNFALQDTTADMLRPVLRVSAYPSTPPEVGYRGDDVSAVINVVIQDASRKGVLQPSSKSTFTYQGLQGLNAEFPLEGLIRLREKNPEFFIVLVGSNGAEKAFRIKKKHFSKLP